MTIAYRAPAFAFIATTTLLGLAGMAHAVDGVILIDQNRALAGNVTPGDAPGFPVTISQPGSYRLSGNLTVPNANVTAIEITGDNVTIDLNGFAIIGPTVCTGSPPTCSPVSGTGFGITSATATTIAVYNGTVRGMGSSGIFFTTGASAAGHIVERVRAESNGGNGIEIAGGNVSYSTAIGNGGVGIGLFEGTASHNTAIANLYGISVDDGTVSHNAALRNRDGAGIVMTVGIASHNTLFNNGVGLQGTSTTGYTDNVMTGNGTDVIGAISLGHNLCSSGPC